MRGVEHSLTRNMFCHYTLFILIILLLFENVLPCLLPPLFLSSVELYFNKAEPISRISIATNSTQHVSSGNYLNNSSASNLWSNKLNVSTNSSVKFILPSHCMEFGRKYIRISFVNGIYHSEEDWRNITKDLESIFGLEVRPFYNPSSGAKL